MEVENKSGNNCGAGILPAFGGGQDAHPTITQLFQQLS
ncbi:hypothetical protein NIES2104_37300 [Leptolyngbya sp. NIES-2104]|nr:hypothetical protein NIES2104_37300 [Leptolyngbya sp. NIES-2104]